MKVGLLVAVLVAGAALAVGCSSDSSDPLTLEEYFAELDALDVDIDARIDALYAGYPDDNTSEEDALTFFKELAAGFPVAISDAYGPLKALDPPAVVADAHDALIEAGEKLVAVYEEIAEAAEDVETLAEFETPAPDVEADFEAADAALVAACLDIVAIGLANGITDDTICEAEE